VIKINRKDLKIILPVVIVFLIILSITLIYPKYGEIWNLLFWISLFYMSIRTLSNYDNKPLKEKLSEIHISVKIAFILAIVIGLCEVYFGNNLVISTALLVLTIILDIIFSRKKVDKS